LTISPYAQAGARLVDNGYSAIPIMPGTKRPGSVSFGTWYGRTDWQVYCDRLPTDLETPIWDKWPEAGVCVAVDWRLKVIDIDTDEPAMMAAVLSVLPDSPVKKRGNKGFSAFYRGSRAIVSTPFSIAVPGLERPMRVVDLLAHGRQTVLPPTIHPDLGKPYEWLTTDTLIDTAIDQLPELPDDIAERIGAALAPFGYMPPEEHRALERGDGDTYWREINDTALRNLSKWVPDLKLQGTKKHGKGYRAVADWRGVENANLSFHPDGITDWGGGENYTAIDIVMAALAGTDLYTATDWLCQRLGLHRDDGFNVAGFIAKSQARKQAAPTTTLVAPAPAPEIAPEEMPVKVPSDTVRIAAPRPKLDPWDFDTQGGVLGKISQWAYETARAPVREFASVTAIGFLSAFYGRRYLTPTGLATNTYLIALAPSGYGKDHPRKCLEYLGHDGGFPGLIGPSSITSDSSVEKNLRRRPSFVMPWDEVGLVLQDMKGGNATSWHKSMRKMFLELYSKGTGIWTGKERADSKTDATGEPIYCPTMSLAAFSTPTEFYAGISEANLTDGFVGRLTLVKPPKGAKPAARQRGQAVLRVPDDIKDALRSALENAPKVGGKLSAALAGDAGSMPELYALEWGEGAEARWQEIEEWQLSLIDEKEEYAGVVNRAAEQTQKFAAIRAISRDPAAPVVRLDDVEWGWAIVAYSLDAIDHGLEAHMFGSEFEKTCKEIERAVAAYGPDGVPRSVLLRRKGISKVKTLDFDNAVKRLIEIGAVTQTLESGTGRGGRPGIRLKVCGPLQ
jgi:hypothetical protein